MTLKQVALTFAITLICLIATAQAQTPRMTTVNISAQSDKVHINAEGDISELRVDVADEQGDVVFQSGAITGNALDWKMRDAQGERVHPGTYLVTVTFHNPAGKLRKRVEQVTIAEDEKTEARPVAAPEALQATVTTTVPTTGGRIAKFAGTAANATSITNSVITESAGKIGIGTTAPTTTLTVTSTAANSPSILAANNGAEGIAIKGGSANVKGVGVWGIHTATTGVTPGVKGETNSTAANAVGVLGVVNSTNAGNYSAAVRGTNNGTGANRAGVWGEQAGDNGYGVYGTAFNGTGVYGFGNKFGVVGNGGFGYGVYGEGNYGVAGKGNYGVFGLSATATGYAGYFEGKAKVTANMEIDGNVGLGTNMPKAKLHVTGGNIFIAQPNSLIITSPNGHCWFIKVDNAGALSTTSVTCP